MKIPYHTLTDEFIEKKNYYILNVDLTKSGLKLYKNLKPIKVMGLLYVDDYYEIDTLRGTKTYNKNIFISSKRISDFICVNSKNKRIVVSGGGYHDPKHCFDSYEEACIFYDKEISKAQVTIKKNIDKYLDGYNNLEKQKINIRKVKIMKLISD